ncbi:MAG: Imm30 family immunity protein [Sarcina sp.]
MTKTEYITSLKENKKLATIEERHLFAKALEALIDVDDFENLYYGFDNDVQDIGIMQGLIFAIESYYGDVSDEKYFNTFIIKSKEVYDDASEWINFMNARILQNQILLDKYIHFAKAQDESTKLFLIKVMKNVQLNNEKKFADVSNKFILEMI